MNNPKNQHWVPKFYLKHFSTPESYSKKEQQVWIFSKQIDSKPLLVNVRKVCSKRYLYSPKNKADERDWNLESKLSRLEKVLAKEWFSLANENIDIVSDESLKKGVALFVATMILRNPETRTDLENTYNKIVKLVEDEPNLTDISAIEINGIKHDFAMDEWYAFKNRDENDHHKFFTNYIESQVINIAEKILKKRWSIVFSEKPVFITSDKPVSIQHLTKENFGIDFGFDTKGSFITFPLSPNRLLLMDDKHNEPNGQYYSPNDNCFGVYNFFTWKNSNRFMISSRDVNEVLYEMDNELNFDDFG